MKKVIGTIGLIAGIFSFITLFYEPLQHLFWYTIGFIWILIFIMWGKNNL